MRRLCAMFILLWLGFGLASGAGSVSLVQQPFYLLAQEENQGPTIDWFGPDASNESHTIAWDGIYNGQTEQSWPLRAWVNDTDDVDTVFFMFRGYSDSEWTNMTPALIEGNDTIGHYQYIYTYAVWWNYTRGYPETEGSGGTFSCKIIANNSLGYWTETGIMSYSGGYMEIIPPPDVVFYRALPAAIIGICVIVVVIAGVYSIRRR